MTKPTRAINLRTRTPAPRRSTEVEVPVEAFTTPQPEALGLMALDELALRPSSALGGSRSSGDLEGLAVFMFVPLGEIPRPSVATGPISEAESPAALGRGWRWVDTLPGYLVVDRGRGVRLAAAVLPLMALASTASAAPGEAPTGGDESEVRAPEASEPTTPAPELAPEPEPEPTAAATAAPATGTLSLTGDEVWAGLRGQDVILRMTDGKEIEGRVLGQAGDQFAFGRAMDGLVVSVPKAQVRTIRIDFDRRNLGADAPDPDQKGIGMLTAGIIMTTVGVPLVIAGTTFLAISPSFLPLHLPMIIPGTAMLSAGIPLTVNGLKRRKAWKAAYGRGTAQISPALDIGGRGFTGGVRLRF